MEKGTASDHPTGQDRQDLMGPLTGCSLVLLATGWILVRLGAAIVLVLALSLEVPLTPAPATPADTLGTALVLLLKLVVPALVGWGGIRLIIHSAHWPGKDQEPW